MGSSSDLSYQFQRFWLAHALQLRRWWVILIIAAEALVLVAAVATLLLFWSDDAALSQRLVRTGRALSTSVGLIPRRPDAVTFGPAVVHLNASKKADVFVLAKNPNTRWQAAHIRYRLRLGSTVTTERDFTLMPEGQRYITIIDEPLGGQAALTPADVSVEVASTDWIFLRDMTIVNQAKFTTNSVTFTPVTVAAGEATRLTYQFTTTGAFTFRTVSVQSVVMSNGAPLAVATQSVTNVRPGLTQTVEASWLSRFPAGVQLQVFAVLDPTDPTIIVTP